MTLPFTGHDEVWDEDFTGKAGKSAHWLSLSKVTAMGHKGCKLNVLLLLLQLLGVWYCFEWDVQAFVP